MKDYQFLSIIYLEVITMADSILRDKAKEFAKKTVFLCGDMKTNHKESVLINQLLRSATLGVVPLRTVI